MDYKISVLLIFSLGLGTLCYDLNFKTDEKLLQVKNFIQEHSIKNKISEKLKFEYSSDLNELNAYDAIGYFKYDYNKESTFFTLNGGLGQIIDYLLLAIKQTESYKRNNINMCNLSHVENVTYNNTTNANANANLFTISVSNYKNSNKTTLGEYLKLIDKFFTLKCDYLKNKPAN